MLLWSLLVIFAPVDGKSDWLTLVAPSAVFEGDRIDLTCQKKNGWKVKRVSYYKDGEELPLSSEVSNFSIQRAVLSDSGTYHCAVAPVWPLFPFQKEKTSRSVRIEVQELFPRPVLTVSPFRAIEGNPVTLTCETKLSPQRSDAQLQFCFFRGGRALGSGWSSSPELRVPAMWSGDSGSYWCEAETVTPSVRKQSLRSQIHVRRVPVSNVSLEMRAPRGQVIEGRNLVLLCSVTEGTGNITFSWHREATGASVGKKTQRSLSVELEVPAVQEHDAGRYYCRADNGHGPIRSKSILETTPAKPTMVSGPGAARWCHSASQGPAATEKNRSQTELSGCWVSLLVLLLLCCFTAGSTRHEEDTLSLMHSEMFPVQILRHPPPPAHPQPSRTCSQIMSMWTLEMGMWLIPLSGASSYQKTQKTPEGQFWRTRTPTSSTLA
ncbi:Fc receptor-like protein 2 isoform X6 [Felis catus]|uniref:Fc receptor-like protein 2 isoform X6 n=1 Tax=Felis catus TaxID=9685 RepID=UPI001D1A30F5|nr:Fc receptor-like protein 2 isoform X6 [Felis catus]